MSRWIDAEILMNKLYELSIDPDNDGCDGATVVYNNQNFTLDELEEIVDAQATVGDGNEKSAPNFEKYKKEIQRELRCLEYTIENAETADCEIAVTSKGPSKCEETDCCECIFYERKARPCVLAFIKWLYEEA